MAEFESPLAHEEEQPIEEPSNLSIEVGDAVEGHMTLSWEATIPPEGSLQIHVLNHERNEWIHWQSATESPYTSNNSLEWHYLHSNISNDGEIQFRVVILNKEGKEVRQKEQSLTIGQNLSNALSEKAEEQEEETVLQEPEDLNIEFGSSVHDYVTIEWNAHVPFRGSLTVQVWNFERNEWITWGDATHSPYRSNNSLEWHFDRKNIDWFGNFEFRVIVGNERGATEMAREYNVTSTSLRDQLRTTQEGAGQLPIEQPRNLEVDFGAQNNDSIFLTWNALQPQNGKIELLVWNREKKTWVSWALERENSRRSHGSIHKLFQENWIDLDGSFRYRISASREGEGEDVEREEKVAECSERLPEQRLSELISEHMPSIVLPRDEVVVLDRRVQIEEKNEQRDYVRGRIEELQNKYFRREEDENKHRTAEIKRLANQMEDKGFDLEGNDSFFNVSSTNAESIRKLAEEIVRIYQDHGVSPPENVTEIFGETTSLNFDADEYNSDGSPQEENAGILARVRQAAEIKHEDLERQNERLKILNSEIQLLEFEQLSPVGYIEIQGTFEFQNNEDGSKRYLSNTDTRGNDQKIEIRSWQSTNNSNIFFLYALESYDRFYVMQNGNRIEFRQGDEVKTATNSLWIVNNELHLLAPSTTDPENGEIPDGNILSFENRLDQLRNDTYFSQLYDWEKDENGNWTKGANSASGPRSKLSADANKRIPEVLADMLGEHLRPSDKLYLILQVGLLGREQFLNTVGEQYFQRGISEFDEEFRTLDEKKQLLVGLEHAIESSRNVDFDAELNSDNEFVNEEYENNWNGIQKFCYRREKQFPGFTTWARSKMEEYRTTLTAEIASVEKRKAGVLRRIQELGETELEASVTLSELEFSPRGNLENCSDWMNDTYVYWFDASYNGKIISFGISVKSPYALKSKDDVNLAGNNKPSLEAFITSEKERIDNLATVESRQAGVLDHVKSLGGENLDDTLTIIGLEFSPIEESPALNKNENWLNDEFIYKRKAVYEGHEFVFGIRVIAPYEITDGNGNSINPQSNAGLEQYLNNRKIEIDHAEDIAQRKAGILARIEELGGAEMHGNITLAELEFHSKFGNGWLSDDYHWMGEGYEYWYTCNYKKQTIEFGFAVNPPHNISIGDSNGDHSVLIDNSKAGLEAYIVEQKQKIDAESE